MTNNPDKDVKKTEKIEEMIQYITTVYPCKCIISYNKGLCTSCKAISSVRKLLTSDILH